MSKEKMRVAIFDRNLPFGKHEVQRFTDVHQICIGPNADPREMFIRSSTFDETKTVMSESEYTVITMSMKVAESEVHDG